MLSNEIRGVVQGRTIMLDESAEPLADGTMVVVRPIDPRRGDPEALFAALDALPPMSDEDAANMLWDIEESDAWSGIASMQKFIEFANSRHRADGLQSLYPKTSALTKQHFSIGEIVERFLSDLNRVARSLPNERLPKEEQIRCSIYSAMQHQFNVVCAERGYGSVDDGNRVECDLWASAEGSESIWLEFKKCWSIAGWVNKANEQEAGWRADVGRLLETPSSHNRYFFLVGFFDQNPLHLDGAHSNEVVSRIRAFHPNQLKYVTAREFNWRPDDGIAWVAVWIWHWQPIE